MDLTDTEKKLLRLGLNEAAKSGEIDACAIKLFRQLRKRKVTVEDLIGPEESESGSIFDDLKRAMSSMSKASGWFEEMEKEQHLDWKEVAIKQQTKIKIQEKRIKLLEKELIQTKKRKL